MSAVVPFTNAEFELSIEPHDADGFRVQAPGIARALGFRDAYRLMESIPDAEKGYTTACTPGGDQRMGYLTEAGFYRALGQRQAARITDPELRGKVERFQSWVYGTVLPEIRKTGGYNTAPALPDRRALAQMVIEAEDRADQEAAARAEAEEYARALEAPAAAWTHMADSAGDYEVGDAAKVLTRDPNIKIGRDRLFSFMAAEGWVYRNRSTNRWKAYQTQVDLGRLTEKLSGPYLHGPSGEMRLPDPTVRITSKGLAELHKRLGGSGQLALVADAS